MAPYQADPACYHTTGAQTVTFHGRARQTNAALSACFPGAGERESPSIPPDGHCQAGQ